MSEMIARVAEALEAANIGWSITLTRLVDGVSTYTARVDGYEPHDFIDFREDASDWVQCIVREHKARAAIQAMREPTEDMKFAPQFSATFGPIEAEDTWRAMIDAALAETAE